MTGLKRALSSIPTHKRPYPQPVPGWTKQQQFEYAIGHWPFVLYMARRFRGPLELPDAVQAGFIGLLLAAKRYIPDQGANFTTYAFYWIRHKILRARAHEHRTIRYPDYIEQRIARLIKSIAHQEMRYGRSFSVNEYEQLLPDDHPSSTLALMSHQFVYPDDLTLYDPVTRTRETYWSKIEPAHCHLISNEPERLQCVMDQGLEILKIVFDAAAGHRQFATVLIFRLGLDADQEPRTLEATGKKMGLTTERVRQIEGVLFRRIHHPSRQKSFREKYGGWFSGWMSNLTDLFEAMAEIDAQNDNSFDFQNRVKQLLAETKDRIEKSNSLRNKTLESNNVTSHDIQVTVEVLRKVKPRNRKIWLDRIGWNPSSQPRTFHDLSWEYKLPIKSVKEALATVNTRPELRLLMATKQSILNSIWTAIKTSHPELYANVLSLHDKPKKKRRL